MQKRISVPKTYNVKRKSYTWITKASPGPHNKNALTITVLMRDILGVAKNTNELKKILNKGELLVDGKIRKDIRFPVGFMDVVSVPESKLYYRVGYDHLGRFNANNIKEKETGLKIVSIKNKIRHGSLYQITTNDGRCINVKLTEGKKLATNDSLLIKVPSQEIVKHLEFKSGAKAFIIGGKHVGQAATIKDIKEDGIVVTIDKNDYKTIKNYVFVTGENKEELSI